MVTDEEGSAAVARAREALAHHLANGTSPESDDPKEDGPRPPVFRERRGVFVTLKRWPRGELRGCIGFPLPVLPLGTAIARAAFAAATEDPRFRTVRLEELDHLTVEVSILTRPEPIEGGRRSDRLAAVRVGRDGLIVEGRGTSGLLLPQVAAEYDWDAETFLRETCRKAGLPPNAWEDPEVDVLRFEAEVFGEGRPGAPATRLRESGPTADA
jgi:uncharacterized protein (TIGR00296 family)